MQKKRRNLCDRRKQILLKAPYFVRKYRFLLLALLTLVAIFSCLALPVSSQTFSLPVDWPPPPLKQEQINAVKACDLKNIAKARYPESIKTDQLESAFSPTSNCDWAVLAFAYTERVKDKEALPDIAKKAVSKAVLGNSGFALATPIFYSYFDQVSLVKAPPQTQQEISQLEIAYRWSGLGRGVNYIVEIRQANTAPKITVASIPGTFNFMDNREKVFGAAMKTKLDKEKVQALTPALRELLPIQSQFSLTPCTDNYPNWVVKITYVDNTMISLTTDSNFLFMGGPWFTKIGQQNYVQFSSAFANALRELVIALGLPVGQTGGMSCYSTDVLGQAFP
jgi:hypothetical protein